MNVDMLRKLSVCSATLWLVLSGTKQCLLLIHI